MFRNTLAPDHSSGHSLLSAQAPVVLSSNPGVEVAGFIAPQEYTLRVIEHAAFAPGTLFEADFSQSACRSKRKQLRAIEQFAHTANESFKGPPAASEHLLVVAINDAAERHKCGLNSMGSRTRRCIARIFSWRRAQRGHRAVIDSSPGFPAGYGQFRILASHVSTPTVPWLRSFSRIASFPVKFFVKA
ncbi:MAG: hypothetical protein ABI790_04560 [Betaproteobacteria bacterium]